MQQSWLIPRMRLPVSVNGHTCTWDIHVDIHVHTLSVLSDWFGSVRACTGITGKHVALYHLIKS